MTPRSRASSCRHWRAGRPGPRIGARAAWRGTAASRPRAWAHLARLRLCNRIGGRPSSCPRIHCLSNKVRDIVGLYLAPPDRTVVLCVDEKTQVQALDRTQPLLPMRPGQVERPPMITRARHDIVVRRSRYRHRPGHRPLLPAPPRGRIPQVSGCGRSGCPGRSRYPPGAHGTRRCCGAHQHVARRHNQPAQQSGAAHRRDQRRGREPVCGDRQDDTGVDAIANGGDLRMPACLIGDNATGKHAERLHRQIERQCQAGDRERYAKEGAGERGYREIADAAAR